MTAVFQIVSRVSGKALTRAGDDQTPIQQFTVDEQDPFQMWLLNPDNPQDPPRREFSRLCRSSRRT